MTQTEAKTDTTEHTGTTYLTPRLTAQMLAGRLGGSTEMWAARLQNQRRPGRRATVPFTTLDGEVAAYDFDEVDSYIHQEQARRIAVSGGDGPDQPRATAGAVLDDGSGPNVRMIIATGKVTQSAFALAPAMARTLAAALIKSADVVDRANGAPT